MNFRILWSLALGASLMASPALAQGKGKGQDKQKHKDRVERIYEDRRDRDHRDDRDWERRDRDWERTQEKRGKGPAFCRNGKGHPVHGWRWCEEKGFGRDRDYDRDRRYDDRYDRDRYGRSGSYHEAHAQFHRRHDQQCRDRAAQRGLDPIWQLRVRQECAARHSEWHRRAGIGHDGRTLERRY